MKDGCLIQDHLHVDLKNLAVKREGNPCVVADIAGETASPSPGEASLVVEGQEFTGNVKQCVGRQIVFEPDEAEALVASLA